MVQSRVRFLEQTLTILNYSKAIAAMDWLMEEMSAEKGYVRHNGVDYYTHPIDCAQDVLNHNIRDQEIITAVLLHDMIEDVPGITVKMVYDKFGLRVANAVKAMTKEKGVDYKNRTNLIHYVNIVGMNPDACVGKAADSKHNFGTLGDANPEKKLRKALEVEDVYIPAFKQWRNTYPRYAAYFFSAKTSIEPHLREIKEHYNEVQLLKNEIEQLKAQMRVQ